MPSASRFSSLRHTVRNHPVVVASSAASVGVLLGAFVAVQLLATPQPRVDSAAVRRVGPDRRELLRILGGAVLRHPRLAGAEHVERFELHYYAATQGSLRNLIDLAHDLGVLKSVQNERKHADHSAEDHADEGSADERPADESALDAS